MSDSVLPVTAAIAAALLSLLLVWLTRAAALRSGMLDSPNSRSSHTTPTPRGGGVGLVLSAVLVFGVVSPRSLPLLPLGAATLAVSCVALVGWFDDRLGGVSPSVRIVVHLLAGLLLLPMAQSAGFASVPWAVAMAWWVFWTISAINVVNFVDGIDGIIGAQVIIFGSHLFVNSGGVAPSLFGAVLAGASLGFLVLNWSPARIFMGDVGSGALGVLFVFGGILYMREGGGLLAAFLPLCPIFLDATVTLLIRAYRRERLSQAHRSHLYQRLANGGLGHARVSAAYALASVVGVAVVLVAQKITVGSVLIYTLACATAGLATLRSIRR